MYRHTAVVTMLLVALAFGISNCTQPLEEPRPKTSSFSAEDAAAVRANLKTYLAGDPIDEPETFFSQFTEDVYWIYGDREPWEGMEGLKGVKWCHTRAAEITADHVDGSGDLAYARGTYRLSLDCEQDAPIDSEGVFLSVHRRQPDGAWRIESLLQPD